jgi:hypothetical protein
MILFTFERKAAMEINVEFSATIVLGKKRRAVDFNG